MKVLVTGGDFGRAIVRKLITNGHEVEILSRSFSDTKDSGVIHHQIDLSKSFEL